MHSFGCTTIQAVASLRSPFVTPRTTLRGSYFLVAVRITIRGSWPQSLGWSHSSLVLGGVRRPCPVAMSRIRNPLRNLPSAEKCNIVQLQESDVCTIIHNYSANIHRRRKLPYTLRSPHCTFLKAVWRAAAASGRTEGANAQQKLPRVNLSGTEDRGSGKAWMTQVSYFSQIAVPWSPCFAFP